MADITIPQLNAATSVSGTDVMVISQAGVTKKVEVDKITEKVLSSSVDILHMNPTTVQTLANIGELAFNPDTQTLEVKCSADVTLSIGQENYIRGKNSEADTVLNGTVVYVSGGQGANSLIKRASNNNTTGERVIGVATQNIGPNNIGFVTTNGIVNEINTSAFAEGDVLWLGVDGALTNVKPGTDVNQICIGVVLRSHATQGSLLVSVKDDWRGQVAQLRSDLSLNTIIKSIPIGTNSVSFDIGRTIKSGTEVNVKLKSSGYLQQDIMYISFAKDGEVLEVNVHNFGPNDTSVMYIEINHTISHDVNQIIIWSSNVVTSYDMEIIVSDRYSNAYYISNQITSLYNNRVSDLYKFGDSITYNYTDANVDVFAFERVLNAHGIVYARLVTSSSINNATVFNEGTSVGISLSKYRWTRIDTSTFTRFAVFLNMASVDEVTLEWVKDSELLEFSAKKNTNILYVGKGDEYDYKTVQEAIDNANDRFDNPITIVVTPGTYEMPIYSRDEFLAKTPYRYLSIIGTDKNQCILYNNVGAYGDDLNGIFHDCATLKMSGRIYIANLTVKSGHSESNDTYGDSKYKSYALHFDSNAVLDSIIEVNNCIVHNSHGACVGFGVNANQKIKLIGCEFESIFIEGSSDFQGAIWGHDLPHDGTYYEKLIIRDCYIKSNNNGIVLLNSYGKEVVLTAINNTFDMQGGVPLTLSSTSLMLLDPLSHGNNVSLI